MEEGLNYILKQEFKLLNELQTKLLTVLLTELQTLEKPKYFQIEFKGSKINLLYSSKEGNCINFKEEKVG